MPPLVYKSLGPENVSIRPFKVFKSQSVSYVSGTDVLDVNVATATDLIDPRSFSTSTGATNADGTFQEPLYETMRHLFYTSGSLSGSADFSAGGDGYRYFPLSSSAYVVNVAQQLFGEEIRPGTFVINTPSEGSGTIIDDGYGRLYVSSSAGSTNVVGNIFYQLGIAVIHRLETAGGAGPELIQETGLYFDDGHTLNTEFRSTVTMHEYRVIVTANSTEFNYSINNSAFGRTSTGSLLDTGSILVVDAIASGTLSPYITSIGLYNDNYELVAVAKFPHPIQRLPKSKQNFIIRFDI